jgi:hypothetical protein
MGKPSHLFARRLGIKRLKNSSNDYQLEFRHSIESDKINNMKFQIIIFINIIVALADVSIAGFIMNFL